MKTPPDHVLHGAHGEMLVWMPCDSLYLTKMTGHLDATMTGTFIAILDAFMAKRGRDICSFNDWEAMENYDSAARTMLVSWTLARRHQFACVHLLVRSKIVQLGVEAANLALGRFMTTHRERVAFERELYGSLGKLGLDGL
jgi:hypothetical protein